MEQNNYNSQTMVNNAQFDSMNTNMPAQATPAKPTPAKKNPNWMLFALTMCAILAVGGIGFGIWTAIDSSSKISELEGEIAKLREQDISTSEQEQSSDGEGPTRADIASAKAWSTSEVRDGMFSVLDDDGNVVTQSDSSKVIVNEIVSCDSSSDNTILTCDVITSMGEGWFLYDAYGDSLLSSFDAEE